MNFLLNKGGAGKSLTRSSTVSEVSKLMSAQIALLGSYEALLGVVDSDSDLAASLSALQKQHRDEIPKLSEIILSSGGIPPRESSPPTGDDVDSLIRAVNDGERAMRTDLEEQIKLKHHLRTIAVLKTLLANTERRIGAIQTVAQQLSIPVG
jgi:bacterioferritin (cytochrome b1)